MSARRLSQAIAEGDGISVLVEVADAGAAAVAGEQGADGLVLRGADPLGASDLPVVAYGHTPEQAAAIAADAVVLSAEVGSDALLDLAERAAGLGLECVLRVVDEDDLERALEHLDPEVFLLSAEEAGDDQASLERVLELLPDVPAGKLAIAELTGASRADVEELERAGVDAVLVAGDVVGLVETALPDV